MSSIISHLVYVMLVLCALACVAMHCVVCAGSSGRQGNKRVSFGLLSLPILSQIKQG